jgi:hypothetical protein
MRNFLHHIFLPRESNNHRAKLLHHKSLLILLSSLLLIEGVLITTEKKFTGVLGDEASISSQDLLNMTNQKRADAGLGPLSLNDELASAATAKASDMFTKDYWAHVAPDGATPWGFIRSAGYEYIYAGENLARGYTSANDVINAWMASPGHRENMLSPNYKDVGFAVQHGTLTGDDTVLVVEEFGSRQNETAAKEVSVITATPQPAITQIPTKAPTRVVIAQVLPSATPTPQPTKAVPAQITPQPSPRLLVASYENSPLVNSSSLKKNIAVGVIAILLATFIVDVILIEKRKIVRHFTHNLDHIIFLSILLIVILIITKGAIL